MRDKKKNLYEKLPDSPGVYLMKDARGRILYIGKAGNLKRRVSSYFTRPHDLRIEKLVSQTSKVSFKKTDTALEALILEAELIKKHKPSYNVKEKDDKSFLYVEITKDYFPRPLLLRGKVGVLGERFGPFTSASSIRESLRIIRRIFPFNIHPPEEIGRFRRPCFDYEIGLCPGVCVGKADRREYLKNIRNIKFLLKGKKKAILRNLDKEMKIASEKLDFERAAKIRRQIFALQHIQDIALISDEQIQNSKFKFRNSARRIEGYDVSNISGTLAVGSMVVFYGQAPDKKEYRLFKIRTIRKSDDVGMLKEVLRRRLNHSEWTLPELILIDGGKGQVNGAKKVLDEFGLKIPVLGIAKGLKRKRNEIVGVLPKYLSIDTLIKVRNEAHRFARAYHRKLRNDAINKKRR